MTKSVGKLIVTLFLLVLLSGCGYESLYSNLDESQANDMMALLLREGFDARKSRTDDTWVLEVAKAHLSPAVDTLKAHGFPKSGYQSLGEIFKKEGFVSSPLEERARLLHGLSQELSRTISNIDGVVVARVHLAIPERNPMTDKTAPSSASIFIKHPAGVSLNKHTSSIKALVVNSVEGLPYDNITVSFFEADPVQSQPAPVSSASIEWGDPRVLPVIAGSLVVLLCLMFVVRTRRRSSQPTTA